jgi:DNA-binding transcriptional ArsR family regulator
MPSTSSRQPRPGERTTRARGARTTERSSESPHDIQKVVSTLQLATSPTRMMILLLLSEGEKYAGEIREALNNPSQPSVSHQLSLLRHGRLVESRREGRKIVYRLSDVGRLVVQAFERLES